MALIDRVANEFDDIQKTAFWKEYRVQLVEQIDRKVRDLKTNTDKDKLPSIQEHIRALEWVAGLPERVFEKAKEKQEK